MQENIVPDTILKSLNRFVIRLQPTLGLCDGWVLTNCPPGTAAGYSYKNDVKN